MRNALLAALALLLAAPALPGVAATPEAPPAAAPCLAPAVGDRCERWSFVHNPGYAVGLVEHPDGDLVYSAATTWDPEGSGSAFMVTALDHAGAEVWSAIFAGPDEGYSEATDLAIDDEGARICVTGWMGTGTGFIPAGYAVAVACYASGTGDLLWERIVPTPEKRWRGASAIAMASVPFPEGNDVVRRDVVFVTGTDEAAPLAGEVHDKNFLTHAFDAESGTPLWESVHDGPGMRWDGARMIEIAPDGRTVYVGGVVTGGYWNYGVVAYDGATGDQVWSRVHEFPESGSDGRKEDWPTAMELSPDGGTLVVTGRTLGDRGGRYGTVAFDAADGSTRWSAIHEGDAGPEEVPDTIRIPPGTPFATVQIKGSTEQGNALAFDPSGDRVYVTGTSRGFPTGPAYTTVAYDVVEGSELWTARYHGPAPGIDEAHGVAVSPSGDRVYVTGRSSRAGARFTGTQGDAWTAFDDIATVAYDRDGEQQWVARFDGSGDIDIGHAITAAEDGVHVAGRTIFRENPLLPFASANLVVLSYDP